MWGLGFRVQGFRFRAAGSVSFLDLGLRFWGLNSLEYAMEKSSLPCSAGSARSRLNPKKDLLGFLFWECKTHVNISPEPMVKTPAPGLGFRVCGSFIS